jgi:hypothetical protein
MKCPCVPKPFVAPACLWRGLTCRCWGVGTRGLCTRFARGKGHRNEETAREDAVGAADVVPAVRTHCGPSLVVCSSWHATIRGASHRGWGRGRHGSR